MRELEEILCMAGYIVKMQKTRALNSRQGGKVGKGYNQVLEKRL